MTAIFGLLHCQCKNNCSDFVRYLRVSSYAMHSMDYAVACLSVTCWYCAKMAKHILKLFPPSPHHFSFSTPKGMAIPKGPLNEGIECRWYKKLWFSTNVSLYFRNDRRQSYSYYGTRIGNQAFAWYHLQWLGHYNDPDFRVTILFNVKWLENGTR